MSRRLAVVRRRVAEVLDGDERQRALRILSLCAGDGRDVLAELEARPDLDAPTVLVELDEVLAQRARVRATGRRDVEVRQGDAGDTETFADAVPVDLLLLCGIFGNISDADIATTVAAAPAMLAEGGTVIWTRGVFESGQDLRRTIRRWFTEAGLEEVAFDGAPERFGVGVARRPVGNRCVSALPARLFTFAR